uniref:Uncharacterized protein n=1 Tax=Opuntia streptacantha TaxID=393608 RepID=A0A7C8YPF7_OPUST
MDIHIKISSSCINLCKYTIKFQKTVYNSSVIRFKEDYSGIHNTRQLSSICQNYNQINKVPNLKNLRKNCYHQGAPRTSRVSRFNDEVLSADRVHHYRRSSSPRPCLEFPVGLLPPLLVCNSAWCFSSKDLLIGD